MLDSTHNLDEDPIDLERSARGEPISPNAAMPTAMDEAIQNLFRNRLSVNEWLKVFLIAAAYDQRFYPSRYETVKA
jgi:hypothetical protein